MQLFQPGHTAENFLLWDVHQGRFLNPIALVTCADKCKCDDQHRIPYTQTRQATAGHSVQCGPCERARRFLVDWLNYLLTPQVDRVNLMSLTALVDGHENLRASMTYRSPDEPQTGGR